MLKKLLLVVVAVIAIILAMAMAKPNEMKIERSMTMKASPEKIYAVINDYHNWGQWSPWDHMDPAMKKTYSGAPSGVGSVYEWLGNDKVGQGRMEITSATPSSNITMKLDFLKPFEAHNVTMFDLAPEGDGTKVTWTMTGQSNFMSKVMQVFMNMDKMVGKDFETGLGNLKGVAEKG